MSKRVLITGASGFLGFHLLNEARKRGYETFAAVRKSSETAHLKGIADHYVELNYASVDDLHHILAGHSLDGIVHAAAVTRSKDAAVYTRVNVEFSKNLAQAAARLENLKSFVFVSSLAAIGPVGFNAARISEKSEMKPVTGYGKSKKKAEEVLSGISDLPLTIIRPTAIYGPREKDLFVLFKTILGGVDLYIGNKPQKLSFIHAEDAALAIISAVRNPSEVKRSYNLTDGNVYNRYAIADRIAEITQKKALRLHLPAGLVRAFAGLSELAYRWSEHYPVLYKERMKEVTAESWDCDINLLRNELEFEPIYNLHSGLENTLQWYTKENWL